MCEIKKKYFIAEIQFYISKHNQFILKRVTRYCGHSKNLRLFLSDHCPGKMQLSPRVSTIQKCNRHNTYYLF